MRVALHFLLPLVLIVGCWTTSAVERARADQQQITAPAMAPGAIAEAPMPYPDGDDDSDSDPQPTVEGASPMSPLELSTDRGYTVAGWPPAAMPESHLSDLPVRPPIA
jgi:hypothetical protein